MSNKTHTKPHSKKKEGEQYYFREYKHPGHNGTKIGHTDWKHRGGMYFSKNEKYLIARVLDGTIDPMPWVESWPLKPLDFEPLIWGEPREIEDDQKANAAKSNSKKKGDDKKRKSNDTKSHDHANAADGDDLQCYNCSNDKKLLKQYKASEHKTRDCPFIQSKAQRQYYQKGKIAPDLNRFKEFADGARDSGTSADESDGD